MTVSPGIGDGPVYFRCKASGASEFQPPIWLEVTDDTVEFRLTGLTAGLTYLVSASCVADFSILIGRASFDTIAIREG